MQTKRERARIRLAAKYREQYAAKVEPPEKSRTLVQFLNSNVGIFLLSTIFITLFSWSYNQFVGWQTAKAKRETTEQHLRLEISQRIRMVHKLLTRFPYVDLNVIRTATYGFRVGTVQVPTHMLIYSPIFDEYAPRSLESLLWELESLVPEPEKAQIRNARNSCFHITEYFDKLVQTEEQTTSNVKGEDKIYFYELAEADKQELEQKVCAVLDSLNLTAE